MMAIILDQYDLYQEGSYSYKAGYLYLSIINNVSVWLSLYCLILFYVATEERLKPFDPFYKFLTVKAVLFFSFYQSCLFQLLVSFEVLDKDLGDMIYNLLTCFEMVLIAHAQSKAFNWNQFQAERGGVSAVNHSAYLQKDNCCLTFFKVLFATKDVLEDAQNTFLKDAE